MTVQTHHTKRVTVKNKQDRTWNSWMVLIWQLASHTAHCRPSRRRTEDFRDVFSTNWRAVLQNTRGSESTGSSVVFCRTVSNDKGTKQGTRANAKLKDALTTAEDFLPLCMACFKRNSASENWECASEATQALYATVSSNCAWSARGGIPARVEENRQ